MSKVEEEHEAMLKFVAAVESIAADFKRMVDGQLAMAQATQDMLRAQTEAAQAMRDDIQS